MGDRGRRELPAVGCRLLPKNQLRPVAAVCGARVEGQAGQQGEGSAIVAVVQDQTHAPNRARRRGSLTPRQEKGIP